MKRRLVMLAGLLACADPVVTVEDVYERASGHAAACTTHLQEGRLIEADRALRASEAEIARWVGESAARRLEPVAGQSLEEWRQYWRERTEVVAEMHFDQVLARLKEGALRPSDVEAFVEAWSTGVLRERWEKERPKAAELTARRHDGAYRFRCVERVDPGRLAGRSPEPGLVCRTLLSLLKARAEGIEIVDEEPPTDGVEDGAAGEIRVRWWGDWLRFPDTNPEEPGWQLARGITAALEVTTRDGRSGWDGPHRLEAQVSLPEPESLTGRTRESLAGLEREKFEEVGRAWGEAIDGWGAFAAAE